MSNKANKGFIKELAKTPAEAPAKQNFAWSKPVVSLPRGNNTMATPHRMREFKSVKPAKDTLVQEHNTHVKNRRGQK